MMHWFIGWDSREEEAYNVCAHSILRHASCPVKIHPIKHRNLRKAGDFWREWRMDGRGQWWDIEDGKPFSTEFAFTRFLTVYLAREMGLQRAYFVDCDFLFLDDVAKLDKEIDRDYAVSCVWHEYKANLGQKMDGQIQQPYQRKNWSSLMAFKVNHPANSRLTPECVSMADGSWLHQFGWLHDSLIGEIDPRWNVLVNNSSPLPKNPGALHYTLGGPWFEEWTPHANDEPWLDERDRSRIPTPTTRMKMIGG
jgi:hypothetical protein